MLDNRVRVELPFPEQIRLILADVIRPQLVGRTVEVSRELVYGPEINARGTGCVVSTLEFFEHQFSKMGHRDLLVTATYRDSAPAADHDQHPRMSTRSVCRKASFKSASRNVAPTTDAGRIVEENLVSSKPLRGGRCAWG
jgi:hypothetical protein